MSRRISIFSCYSIIYEIIWIFSEKKTKFVLFFPLRGDAKNTTEGWKRNFKFQMHVFTLLLCWSCSELMRLIKTKMINIFSCEMANNFDEESFLCVLFCLFSVLKGFSIRQFFSPIIMIIFCSSLLLFHQQYRPYEELIKLPPTITLIFWYILFVLYMICEQVGWGEEWRRERVMENGKCRRERVQARRARGKFGKLFRVSKQP